MEIRFKPELTVMPTIEESAQTQKVRIKLAKQSEKENQAFSQTAIEATKSKNQDQLHRGWETRVIVEKTNVFDNNSTSVGYSKKVEEVAKMLREKMVP